MIFTIQVKSLSTSQVVTASSEVDCGKSLTEEITFYVS